MKLRLVLAVLALLLIACFASLGRWQLGRAVEKEQTLAEVSAVLANRQSLPLPTSARAAQGYSWATGRGRFLSAPVLLLDNQRRGNAVGVRVFGVFRPELPTAGSPRGEPSPAVLVDLGWLPLPGDRRLPAVTLPEGTLEVSGLLAPPPAPGISMGPAIGKSEGGRWLLTRVDIDALSGELGLPLARRVLRLDPGLPIGYARDLDVLPNTLPPERHRGYAVQWFGLALLTLVVFLFLGFRRRRA